MPRAHRHYQPGFIYHITHRCHQKHFLLDSSYLRERYIYWLNEGNRRFGSKLLNYVLTSNHVHLLFLDTSQHAIANTMQLVAGRVAQEHHFHTIPMMNENTLVLSVASRSNFDISLPPKVKTLLGRDIQTLSGYQSSKTRRCQSSWV